MPTIEVKVYPSSELNVLVGEYATEHGLTRSKAWQELARRGLQREEIQE